MRLLLIVQLVLIYIGVHLETFVGLSTSFKIYIYALILLIILVYQLVLWYISVNLETFLGLSIRFKIYKR